MKKLILTGAILSVLFSACAPDDSDVPQGPDDDRDKFTGSWVCRETITGSPSTTFTIVISKVGSGDSIKIKNFSNYGDFTYAGALVNGSSLTIPQQNMGVTAIPVNGSGEYKSVGNGKITFDYSVDNQNATADCTR